MTASGFYYFIIRYNGIFVKMSYMYDRRQLRWDFGHWVFGRVIFPLVWKVCSTDPCFIVNTWGLCSFVLGTSGC